MSEVHRSKRSSCVREGVWNPPQSSRVYRITVWPFVWLRVCVCVCNGKIQFNFLGFGVHIESSVHRDKALFPPHFHLLCVCVQWRYVYLSPGDRAFLGSGRSLVSYARSRDTLENSPVEYPSWQGWISWFQFTIMAVILTLISLLLIPSFSTRCRHGNQTQHKIPMKSAHADLKTLSITAVARESESIEFLNKTPALCHTGFNGHTLCHSKCYNKDWPLKSSLIMWVNERGTPTVLQ